MPAYVYTNAIPQQAFSTIVPTRHTTVVVVVVMPSDESFVLLGQLRSSDIGRERQRPTRSNLGTGPAWTKGPITNAHKAAARGAVNPYIVYSIRFDVEGISRVVEVLY